MARQYTHEDKMDFLFKFAKNYESYTPDSKDIMRAETCTTRPNPVKAAQAQLKRIEDVDKFYRRLKAFLQHGIKINSLPFSFLTNTSIPSSMALVELTIFENAPRINTKKQI